MHTYKYLFLILTKAHLYAQRTANIVTKCKSGFYRKVIRDKNVPFQINCNASRLKNSKSDQELPVTFIGIDSENEISIKKPKTLNGRVSLGGKGFTSSRGETFRIR